MGLCRGAGKVEKGGQEAWGSAPPRKAPSLFPLTVSPGGFCTQTLTVPSAGAQQPPTSPWYKLKAAESPRHASPRGCCSSRWRDSPKPAHSQPSAQRVTRPGSPELSQRRGQRGLVDRQRRAGEGKEPVQKTPADPSGQCCPGSQGTSRRPRQPSGAAQQGRGSLQTPQG